MKSIELTAYVVREYDAKYTVVLDENDPFVQEMLFLNGMEFDDLAKLDFVDNQGLWNNIMGIPSTEIDIHEDFAQGDERFVDFEAFITENK